MSTSLKIELAGERVCLWPQRALSWRQTLFIADPHFGKAAAFRALGIATPDGTVDDLYRLNVLLAATQATQLIVLGDFLHARAGLSEATVAALENWRSRHAELEITLVRGNHDRASGDPPAVLNIHCVPEPWRLGPFLCRHEPLECADGHALAGHIHPGVVLRERNGASIRAPCFAVGSRVTILPAFGSFTGSKEAEVSGESRLFAVTPDTVLEIPRVSRQPDSE